MFFLLRLKKNYLTNFKNINPSKKVLVSTWADLEWGGDRLTGKIFKPDQKWSQNRTYNNWKEVLRQKKLFLKLLLDNFYYKIIMKIKHKVLF